MPPTEGEYVLFDAGVFIGALLDGEPARAVTGGAADRATDAGGSGVGGGQALGATGTRDGEPVAKG
jgi:hypothetical protein